MPIPALIGAAAISAGASVASGIANNINSRAIANKQLEKNYQLWKEQNAYNSPSAQVARLKAAGLNPALAYGGSSQVVGNADPTPQLDYSGAINTPMFGSDSAIQLGQTAAQIAKQFQVQDASIESMQAQALRDRAQAASTDALRDPSVKQMLSQNELNLAKKNESYQNAQTLEAQMDLLLEQRNLVIEETNGYRLNNEYASRSMEFRVASADLNNKEALSRIQVNKSLAAKYGAEIDQIMADAKLKVSQKENVEHDTNLKDANINLARQNAKVASASEKQINALEKKIIAETGLTEKQVKWFTADHVVSYFGTITSGASNLARGAASLGMAGIL